MFIRKSAFVIIPSLALSITACDEPLRPDPPDPQFGATASEPAAPTMVVVSAAYVHVLEVWWQDNSSNETGFEVEQSTTGPAGAFSKVATFAAALDATGIQHSYSDWGLPPVTEYCYACGRCGPKVAKRFTRRTRASCARRRCRLALRLP